MRTYFYILAVLVTLQSFTLVTSTDQTSSSLTTTTTTTTMTMTPFTTSSTSTTTKTTQTSSETTTEATIIASSTTSEIPTVELDKQNSLDSSSSTNSDTAASPDAATAAANDKLDVDTKVKVEKNLLSLFGMAKRPNPIDRSKIVIPEAMKQLYAEMMGDELKESVNLPKPGLLSKSANTVRSFIHEEGKIDERFLHHHRFRLYFNITGIPQNEKLKAAELELYRDPILDGTLQRHKVYVFDIVRPGVKGKSEPVLYLIDTKTVHINASETVGLDVMPAVDRWLRRPKENYGILIQVSVGQSIDAPPAHRHIRLRRSLEEPIEDWAKKQPILMTYTDDGRYKQRTIRDITRGRRAPNRRSHKRHQGRELCQRKPLHVDFDKVGWSDWIVAPTGYDAYYCQGECHFPFGDHLNTTNHAVVQTLVNSINSDLAPKACCIPTQLKPISMLYLDDKNKVVLKSYQDMEVVGCGCR